MSKCRRCAYSCFVDIGDNGEMLRACIYILYRGERRPCPPGKNCTVFLPREERPRDGRKPNNGENVL